MVLYLILSSLCKDFVRDYSFDCYCMLLQLKYLQFSLMSMRDHEIRIANVAEGFTIFLKDTKCLNRVKSYEKTYSSKTNFSKRQACAGAYKIELINQSKWYGHIVTVLY